MTTSLNAARRLQSRSQAGLVLTEVLVAIALTALLVSATTGGVIAVTKASERANSSSRATVLLSSFAESLQQMMYLNCMSDDLVRDYNATWALQDEKLAPNAKLIRAGEQTAVAVEVVDTLGGCIAGEADKGEQLLTISATVSGVTRRSEFVKIDPDYRPGGPVAQIRSTEVSSPGDQRVIFALSAERSSPLAEIVGFDWECPGSQEAPQPVVAGQNDVVECSYLATNASQQRTVRLVVTDFLGRSSAATASLTVNPAASPRLAPTAVISASPASGTAPLNVTFSSTGSQSPEGSIVRYEWNFGDPLSGDDNVVVTTTPTAPTHRYVRAGTFPARLDVFDDIGLKGSATTNVVVAAPGQPVPIADFTMTPSSGVAPQNVSFDASASRANGGPAISSYEWSFGEGPVRGGQQTNWTYLSPGTYTVRLTVTNSAGVSAFTTKTLVLRPFVAPPTFRLTGSSPELMSDGKFYFSWTNLEFSPGDVVTHEIRVSAVAGCIAFGTKTRTVAAGAGGTNQSYTFSVSWPASNVCAGSQYEWQMRTHRVSPTEGTSVTGWTPNIRFFV